MYILLLASSPLVPGFLARSLSSCPVQQPGKVSAPHVATPCQVHSLATLSLSIYLYLHTRMYISAHGCDYGVGEAVARPEDNAQKSVKLNPN